MKTNQIETKTVDDYIASFPKETQVILKKVRLTIKKAAPDTEETIKYQIPTYTLMGNVLSFAGYKNHIGVYPAPAGTKKFQKELAGYRAAKSSVRFPLDQPIPYDLISQLVKFRVKEHLASVKGKRK